VNLYRYASTNPTTYIDPSGLVRDKPDPGGLSVNEKGAIKKCLDKMLSRDYRVRKAGHRELEVILNKLKRQSAAKEINGVEWTLDLAYNQAPYAKSKEVHRHMHLIFQKRIIPGSLTGRWTNWVRGLTNMNTANNGEKQLNNVANVPMGLLLYKFLSTDRIVIRLRGINNKVDQIMTDLLKKTRRW
jgi:hypothetical protein